MRSVNDGFVREPVYVLPSPLPPLELKAQKVASQAPLNAKGFRVSGFGFKGFRVQGQSSSSCRGSCSCSSST